MKKLEPAPYFETIIYSTAGSERIFSLIRQIEFNKDVNKLNEDYYYWDKAKYLKTPDGITHEEVWAVAKLRSRNTPFIIWFGE